MFSSVKDLLNIQNIFQNVGIQVFIVSKNINNILPESIGYPNFVWVTAWPGLGVFFYTIAMDSGDRKIAGTGGLI